VPGFDDGEQIKSVFDDCVYHDGGLVAERAHVEDADGQWSSVGWRVVGACRVTSRRAKHVFLGDRRVLSGVVVDDVDTDD